MNKNDIESDPRAEALETPGTVIDHASEEVGTTGHPHTDPASDRSEDVSESAETGEETPAAPAPDTTAEIQAVTIRPVAQSDFFAWYGLFAEYADFYEETLTDDRAMRAWAWLHSDEFQVRGLVAVDNSSGDVVGIAHVRPFERPLEGGMGLYLDDLFVRADVRGKGFGRALIDSVAAQAREGGYGVVRWITAEDNQTARKLYDSVAEKTPWVTYDIAIG